MWYSRKLLRMPLEAHQMWCSHVCRAPFSLQKRVAKSILMLFVRGTFGIPASHIHQPQRGLNIHTG